MPRNFLFASNNNRYSLALPATFLTVSDALPNSDCLGSAIPEKPMCWYYYLLLLLVIPSTGFCQVVYIECTVPPETAVPQWNQGSVNWICVRILATMTRLCIRTSESHLVFSANSCAYCAGLRISRQSPGVNNVAIKHAATKCLPRYCRGSEMVESISLPSTRASISHSFMSTVIYSSGQCQLQPYTNTPAAGSV